MLGHHSIHDLLWASVFASSAVGTSNLAEVADSPVEEKIIYYIAHRQVTEILKKIEDPDVDDVSVIIVPNTFYNFPNH